MSLSLAYQPVLVHAISTPVSETKATALTFLGPFQSTKPPLKVIILTGMSRSGPSSVISRIIISESPVQSDIRVDK